MLLPFLSFVLPFSVVLVIGCSGDRNAPPERVQADGKVSSEAFRQEATVRETGNIDIEPAEVHRGMLVHIPLNTKLPDGSTVEWLVNGQAVPGYNSFAMDTARLNKGDTIQARAAWKGGATVSQVVTVKNSPPEVRGVRFVLGQSGAGIPLGVDAEGYDADGDKVKLGVAWTKNGESAGTGNRLGTLPKRGDVIAVTITPSDGETEGKAVTLTREIRNTPPVIDGQEQFDVRDNVVTFHVRAFDADGDSLKYTIREAPAGMSIDPGNGWVRWETASQTTGKIPFTVVVSDGSGGEATARISVTIAEQNPAEKR